MDDATLAATLQKLEEGRLEMEGLITWGTNYTFLVQVLGETPPDSLQAIYKPQRGERPLWDFPVGTLCLRERAAFLVSEALGWRLTPPTILRDGPQGYGSLQLFIDHDPNQHYLRFGEQPQYHPQIRQIVLFDYVINNADRKSGHVLLDDANRLWAIDHGICFHAEYKLRTVIWEFAGAPISPVECDALQQLKNQLETPAGALTTQLCHLISPRELEAMVRRLDTLLASQMFPKPRAGRHYPWPPV